MSKTRNEYGVGRAFRIDGGILAVFDVGADEDLVEETVPDGSTGIIIALDSICPLPERYVYAEVVFPSGDFFERVLIDIEDPLSGEGLSARSGIVMGCEQ